MSFQDSFVRKLNTPFCAKSGKCRRTFKYVNGVLTEVTSNAMKRKLATINNEQHNDHQKSTQAPKGKD